MEEYDNIITENIANEPKCIQEQSAKIISEGKVFYNPVQEFNRDISVSVLNVFIQRLGKEREKVVNKNNSSSDSLSLNNGVRILEALSATGLRSIRYAKEVPGIKEIIANDISKSAVESIKQNVNINNVQHVVTPSHSDATTLMYLSTSTEKRFDIIDLDPYGCPNRFLDSAIQSIANGGLLLVTATDMAVLAGNTPEACFAKYGSVSLRNKSCHEMAIRILLRCIEGHANRYGKYIEPLLSISADFYIRVFVRIYTSQLKTKYSMSKQSMVYQCTGCETLTLQPMGTLKPNPTERNPHQVKFVIPKGPYVGTNCEHCRHKHFLGGPIWSAPIHDNIFVEELLNIIKTEPLCNLETNRRQIGMLSVIAEELPDIPLYYSVDKMCSIVRLEIIPILKFRSALLHAGYKVSFSHAFKNSIKTNAPTLVLWDILRSWNKLHPVKSERLILGTPVKNILDKEPDKIYNLETMHPDANPESRKKALVRFPENPTSHWGPGTRSTLMIGEDKLLKSYKNQNKKQKLRNSIEGDSSQQNKHIKL